MWQLVGSLLLLSNEHLMHKPDWDFWDHLHLEMLVQIFGVTQANLELVINMFFSGEEWDCLNKVQTLPN